MNVSTGINLVLLNRDLQIATQSWVAASAWVAYDIALTLGEEIEYVWLSPGWGLPKILYVYIRYVGIAPLFFVSIENWFAFLPQATCASDISVWASFQLVELFMVDLFLLLRLRALFYGNLKVLRFLWSGFVVATTTEITGVILLTKGTIETSRPDYVSALGCYMAQPGPYFRLGVTLAYGSACLWAGCLFALTVMKIYPFVKDQRSRTPFLSLFLRDGGAYFGVIFCAYVATILFMAAISDGSRQGLLNVCSAWTHGMMIVAASRLFLNLRGVLARPSSGETLPPVQDTGNA